MRNIHLKENLHFLWPDRKFTSCSDEDKVVLDFFNHKKKGYCIDIGAADGVTHNNCIKLFNEYDWSGISIEANPKFYQFLHHTFEDTDIHIATCAVHSTESYITFYQVHEDIFAGYSGINPPPSNFLTNTLQVECKNINTILQEANAPSIIDFVSIDIEEAEEHVLYDWNFSKYKVKMWCCERGERLGDFWEKNGYRRYDTSKYDVVPYNHFYILSDI